VNRFWDVFGLVVVSVIVAILARNPGAISAFFNGASKLAGTALN